MKKKANLHSCNVLETGAEQRQLWQFSADGKITLTEEQTFSTGQTLPRHAVSKTWRSLWQPKLNIAWFPSEHIFLRVVHLPAADFAELHSMVELQLEKLSPLPVNQMVWSIEVLPRSADTLQSVIVIIVARSAVEQFLSTLEGGGFLPDRLEVPHLHQLLAAWPEKDVVQLYPSREQGQIVCLIGWWTGGVLQNLELLRLPDTSDRAEVLARHLTKTAWAGELEGWLGGPVAACLIAHEAGAREWEPALRDWHGQPIEVVEPLSRTALAELSAGRAAREESKANLLPDEYSARYQRQFVDRLWMNGLGAVAAAYIVGVVIYFGFLQVLNYQKHSVERQVAAVSGTYTNAVKMKARADVLQTQLNLKYAALDCLRAASEHLPGELTLSQFSFSRGQTLLLNGTAQLGQTEPMYEYSARLRSSTVNGEPLFSKVDVPTYTPRGGSLFWTFSCELNRPQPE